MNFKVCTFKKPTKQAEGIDGQCDNLLSLAVSPSHKLSESPEYQAHYFNLPGDPSRATFGDSRAVKKSAQQELCILQCALLCFNLLYF